MILLQKKKKKYLIKNSKCARVFRKNGTIDETYVEIKSSKVNPEVYINPELLLRHNTACNMYLRFRIYRLFQDT